MKNVLVLAFMCLMATGAFAQKAIHAEAIKGPNGTPELTATGAFAFQAGELADSVRKTEEQVILVFNKYRMTVVIPKESYPAYLDMLARKREQKQPAIQSYRGLPVQKTKILPQGNHWERIRAARMVIPSAPPDWEKSGYYPSSVDR